MVGSVHRQPTPAPGDRRGVIILIPIIMNPTWYGLQTFQDHALAHDYVFAGQLARWGLLEATKKLLAPTVPPANTAKLLESVHRLFARLAQQDNLLLLHRRHAPTVLVDSMPTMMVPAVARNVLRDVSLWQLLLNPYQPALNVLLVVIRV